MVTKDGCEVLTRFPAEELLIAGAHYHTVGGPLPTPRETQSHLNRDAGDSPADPFPASAPLEGSRLRL